MKAIEIVQELQNKKGRHIRATWSRMAKTFANCPHVITKRTSVFVRSGINFEHIAVVQNGIEKGERPEVQPLPWGQWREGFFPYVIDHKGIEYIRLYPATFDNLTPSVEWTIDGTPANFEKVKSFLLSSELPKKDEKPLCFTVKVESIIGIGDLK